MGRLGSTDPMIESGKVGLVGSVTNEHNQLIKDLEEGGLILSKIEESELLLDQVDVLVFLNPESKAFPEQLKKLRLEYLPEQKPIFAWADSRQKLPRESFLADGLNDFFLKKQAGSEIVAKIHNVLGIKRRFGEIRSSYERLNLAARGTNDGIWDWDLIEDHITFSDQWKNLLGIPRERSLHTPEDLFSLIHPDDLATVRSKLAVHLEGVEGRFECQFRMEHSKGEYIWVLCRGMCTFDKNRKPKRIAGTLTDLTDRSLHDTRTGLPFRNFFMDRLKQALFRCQLNSDLHYAVLYIDIDRFKVISEGLGHDMVDELLVAFAKRLEKCLGPGDIAAFLGGDTFVVLVEDAQELPNAQQIANQIHMQLIAPFHIFEHDVFTKASIGLALLDHSVAQPETVLQRAQTAMKFARSLGSGHSQIYGEGMSSRGRELLQMESKLRHALDRQEFLIYFQPQLRLADMRIVGMETLIRWKCGDDWVSPGKFIPIAEETDLILQIGEWVLREACRQAVKWRRMGFPPLRLSVNLSERQFHSHKLVRTVEKILGETSMNPGHLELELTESIFMEDTDLALKTLQAFRGMGIKTALDDFGTGYSSLSYLKKFPLTTLKIDKAFVNDITTNPGDAAICSTIISLAHKFNMDVIAEGVEKEEQLIILRAFQCNEIQGHYFSKALSAADFERLLAEHHAKLDREVAFQNQTIKIPLSHLPNASGRDF